MEEKEKQVVFFYIKAWERSESLVDKKEHSIGFFES